MNTSIWVRSLITKQYSQEKFFKYVSESIGKEFQKDIKINISEPIYELIIENNIIKIHKKKVYKLQNTGLYFLDRYILDELKNQGVRFDITKSNYLKCCYGIFNDENDLNKVNTRFNQMFTIPIQEGCLFYPCCGTDTYEPISLFINTIKEFHFASEDRITLPKLECGIENGRKYLTGFNKDEVVSSEIVSFATSLSNKKNYDLIKKIEADSLINLEFINIDDLSHKEIWKTKFYKNKRVDIYLHKFEGLLSLLAVDNISVFYYRVHEIKNNEIYRASFNWFAPKPFNMVLNKIVDKGLIITDARMPDLQEEVPWSNLWKRNRQDTFEYNKRKFIYIGKYKEGPNTLYIWQINKEKN